MQTLTGCSAAWLAHLPWEQGVGGSNPLTPTIFPAPVAQLDPVYGGYGEAVNTNDCDSFIRGFESH
jgi:hypothetical protein